MNISPISFKSLMVVKKESSETSAKTMLSWAFRPNGGTIEGYNFVDASDKFEPSNELQDGTVHNATMNYAKSLDEKYRKHLEDNPKDVIYTEAKFTSRTGEPVKRVFLTAATYSDEQKIHKTLTGIGGRFLVAKFPYVKEIYK